MKSPRDGMAFNDSHASMNMTKIPFYVEDHIAMEKYIITRGMKKKQSQNGAPSLLDWEDHSRLRHIRYKLTNHIDVQYQGTERNRQDPKSAAGDDFLGNNYFLHPTFFYNRTNLMPAVE
jgi:hypothetical protein